MRRRGSSEIEWVSEKDEDEKSLEAENANVEEESVLKRDKDAFLQLESKGASGKGERREGNELDTRRKKE